MEEPVPSPLPEPQLLSKHRRSVHEEEEEMEEVSPMEIVAQLRKSRRPAEKSEQFETDVSEDELTYDQDTDVSILERAKRGLG